MRVTTQMLNESARKAGLPIGNASLLNYINGDNTQSMQNSLLNALNSSQNSTVGKTQRAGYEKLEEAADGLLETMNAFLAEGEDSIFNKAGEDNQAVYDTVKKMVENYNSTVKSLKNTSSPLNDFYKQMMGEAAEENKDGLAEIGITLAEDGTLSLDKEKLSAADMETIKSLLGADSTFGAKLAFLADRVSDNAKANTMSFSSQYGADGNSYLAAVNKYNFWG